MTVGTAMYSIGDKYVIVDGPKKGQTATVLWERTVTPADAEPYQHVAVESSAGERWTFRS